MKHKSLRISPYHKSQNELVNVCTLNKIIPKSTLYQPHPYPKSASKRSAPKAAAYHARPVMFRSPSSPAAYAENKKGVRGYMPKKGL